MSNTNNTDIDIGIANAATMIGNMRDAAAPGGRHTRRSTMSRVRIRFESIRFAAVGTAGPDIGPGHGIVVWGTGTAGPDIGPDHGIVVWGTGKTEAEALARAARQDGVDKVALTAVAFNIDDSVSVARLASWFFPCSTCWFSREFQQHAAEAVRGEARSQAASD